MWYSWLIILSLHCHSANISLLVSTIVKYVKVLGEKCFASCFHLPNEIIHFFRAFVFSSFYFVCFELVRRALLTRLTYFELLVSWFSAECFYFLPFYISTFSCLFFIYYELFYTGMRVVIVMARTFSRLTQVARHSIDPGNLYLDNKLGLAFSNISGSCYCYF